MSKMSVGRMLNLKDAVTVTRLVTSSDGMGGTTTVSTLTTIAKASIWTVSSGDARLSDKITKTSSHVLAMLPGVYTFNATDKLVSYNGNEYTLTGNQDNVAERDGLLLIGLELKK